MRSTNLRNKPVDRRYLSDQDKRDYNQSGEYSSHATALSRARQRRGQMAYQSNRPMNTQGRTPGSGSFNAKGELQQRRLGKYGQSKRSDFQVKPPSNKGDIYGPKN